MNIYIFWYKYYIKNILELYIFFILVMYLFIDDI